MDKTAAEVTAQDTKEERDKKSSDAVTIEDGADFETAISATGFGKFNLIYLILSAPSVFGNQFEGTTLSYVLPAAECDLGLTLQNKGTLNAISYIGMICSGFVWGFLSDTLGRKKLLVIGYLINGIFVVISGFSQQQLSIIITKFMSGFIICGPFAILTTTISEFHSAKYRARIVIIVGLIFSFTNVVLPLLSWAILPMHVSLYFSQTFVLHSWNVLLMVSAVPSLLSGFIHMFFPESPKFLMTMGRNAEALEVFRKVYAINTGKPPETFPIKALIDEIEMQNQKSNAYGNVTANRTKVQALKEGFKQIRPLFFPPLLQQLLLVCILQLGFMGGLNTLRLWLPQIFQSINDYESLHEDDADLCTMLAMLNPATKENVTEQCTVNLDNDSVYINNVIVGIVSILGYVVIACVINCIGKKPIMLCLGIISGVSSFGLYFATTSAAVLVLSSFVFTFAAICINVLVAVVVDLFPTTFRAMTMSIVMVIGRVGIICGNLIFPFLLSLGCFPPFATIGGTVLLCTLLTLLLPKTDMKALE